MKHLIWLAILLPLFAQANPYTEAYCVANPADDICIGFNLDRDRLDELEDQDEAVLSQNEKNYLLGAQLDQDFLLQRLALDNNYACGALYAFGCTSMTNTAGSLNITAQFISSNSIRAKDLTTGFRVTGQPINIAVYNDFRWVGIANNNLHFNVPFVVDNCVNPTYGLVNNAITQNAKRAPLDIMDNNGRLYYRDQSPAVPFGTEVVDGGTYGVMNYITHGDVTTPICTPGQTGFEGTWDKYTYTFALDTTTAQFAGPWTLSGPPVQ